MIPMQFRTLEKKRCYRREDYQRKNLLNNLELHQREWTAIVAKAYATAWNLKTIFKKSQSPTKKYYPEKRPRC